MGNKNLSLVLILLISIGLVSSFGFDNPEIPSLRVPTGNVTYNQNITNIYQNITGSLWNGSATTNLDMNGYYITEIGKLIMEGLLISEDIIPATDDIYFLGNSTHWFSEAFIKTLNAENITTVDLSSTNVYSTNGEIETLESIEINSTDVNSKNITAEEGVNVGGARVYTVGETTFYRGA